MIDQRIKLLITGRTGFIGSAVIRHIKLATAI
jgi:nucleoside-diphosphate-sugar epimerase